MAAPGDTVRQTPAGIYLKNGYSTKVAFARAPSISLWERTAKPPGVEGGDGIDTTTMFNTTYRTMAARTLITLGESSFKAAYDPNVYNTILTLVNQEGAITHHFPDGSTLSYFGFLKGFEPDEMQEGTMPEATVSIVPTNYDPVAHVEADPVLTSVAGT